MFPLEHLAIRPLPKDLFRPQLKHVTDGSELSRPVESLHPQVPLLHRLQKKHALVYLRQLYLDLPIFHSLQFLEGELARIKNKRGVHLLRETQLVLVRVDGEAAD